MRHSIMEFSNPSEQINIESFNVFALVHGEALWFTVIWCFPLNLESVLNV